jgi:hypothetical protein
MLRREFLAGAALVGQSAGQDPRLNRAARLGQQQLLRGLQKIGASVNLFGDAAAWVDSGRLQIRTELELRRLGVSVESGLSSPDPTLMLMIYTLVADQVVFITLTAQVVEPVKPVRWASGATLGHTWGGEPLLTWSTRANLSNELNDATTVLCELFANDWLASRGK